MMEQSALDTVLLNIIETSSLSLSTREISFKLRSRNFIVPDYQVSKALRKLLGSGQLLFQKNKWSARKKDSSGITPPISPKIITPPPPSPELEELQKELGIGQKPTVVVEDIIEPTEDEQEFAIDYGGEWGKFRRLVSYYRKCVKNEEGAEAIAYVDQVFKNYIFLARSGQWYPRYGRLWRLSLPLGSHLSKFIKNLDKAASERALVLGYPLQAVYIKKQGEPDNAFVQPIFYFSIDHQISHGAVTFSIDVPRPEINLKWLQYAFSNNAKRQHSFLSACGFINRSMPNDEAYATEREERIPSLDNLVASLSAFMPERIQETLHLDSITDNMLKDPFETGVYNRAVIMLANKTRYTETLLKELAFIEKVSDKTLDRTSLKYIFTDNDIVETSTEEQLPHEGIVADVIQMNAEQRRAAASLVDSNVTVVTGPPGTGKSQVVSSSIANLRLKNQTVLFASRNHKAIDAVYGRLIDQKERPIIIRTNSKDDPSFRFTFVHAIKEMLAIPRDQSKVEKIEHVKGEIADLLDSRGITAKEANIIETKSLKLGELENRFANISLSLSQSQIDYLSKNPEQFPEASLRKVIENLQSIQSSGYSQSTSTKLNFLFRAILLFPWIWNAKIKLKAFPGAIQIPYFFGSLPPKQISTLLKILKCCSELVDLRKRIIPLENELKRLPELEKLTNEIEQYSKRLAEIVPGAITLDLDSREGLPDDFDTEELAGLQAAIRSIRTGLETGIIEAETERILLERVPIVLDSFPGWAVTNLSAGSRIPLVAGMYDLAIVDEASQSDIPSAIPILFRAKRIGVVGDPFQLTHTSKLSTTKDILLRHEVGLKKVQDLRYAYTESSLYDLIVSSKHASPIFLSETYRSESSIAEYSNQTFYSGRLRVATDPQKLKVPYGMKPGLHWTETKGEIKSGGGSGCYCQAEVDEVVRLVTTILCGRATDETFETGSSGFKGTIGIVTPFRQHANRLQDAIFDGGLPFDALTRAEVQIDTAHGFQGDERDVIIFSLCAGLGMPAGSLSFLRETGNLFNVAVSRARALLHVVGNKEWAKSCGIKHVQNLTVSRIKRQYHAQESPWHPHESPWEQILHNALVSKGLEPLPQFPVSSRRLDLALIRKGDNPLQIDIEVDGDCHRNSDGSRKIDDLWRDIQLRGMGWKVMRFWVYQLREDLESCVNKINEYWSKA